MRTTSDTAVKAQVVTVTNLSEVASRATEIDDEQIGATIANWDVKASGQRLFVARIKHAQTQGGLYIPQQWQEQQCDGVVISAGPLAYVNDDPPEDAAEASRRLAMSPEELDCASRRFLKAGDRVTFGRWSGDPVTRKGSVKHGLDTLMVMNADDVIGTPRRRSE